MDSMTVPSTEDFVSPDFRKRFVLTWLLSFRERVSEQLYTAQEQSPSRLLTMCPILLSAYALFTVFDPLLAALSAVYVVVAVGRLPLVDCLAATATHYSITLLQPELGSALSCLFYFSLGTLHTALMTTWRKLAALAVLSMVCRFGDPGTLLAALTLIYVFEKRQRELWRLEEIAKYGESQAIQLLESQNIGLVISDFSGRIVYHNPSSTHFLEACSSDSVLSPSVFSSLFRQANAGLDSEVQLSPSESAVSAKVQCHRITWFDRNCLLVSFTEITDWLQTVAALSRVEAKVLNEVSTLERDANRKFRDTNDPSTQLQLCRLHTILQEVNTALAVQRTCSSQYESVETVFNIRAEFLDAVEFSSLWPENKILVVGLTFEPGVPTGVNGDKVAVGCMFKYLYGRTMEASCRGSTVAIRITVSGAVANKVKIEVCFDIQGEDWHKLSQDLASVSTAIHQNVHTHIADAELTAFQVMLRALHGDCSCSNQRTDIQSDRLQVWYNFLVQAESKAEGRFHQPVASVVRQDLSADKFRWDYKADLPDESRTFVRKRYVKRRSKVKGEEIKGKGLLDPEALMPIAETNSSEQLPPTDKPVELPEDPEIPKTALIPPIAHLRTSSLQVPPTDFDIPGEGSVSPPSWSLIRHHCDLRQVSSQESSPFGHSLLSSRSAF